MGAGISSFLLSGLGAEEKGRYISIGLQFSVSELSASVKKDGQPLSFKESVSQEDDSGTFGMGGINLRVGYKNFFGKKKRFGLRYYLNLEANYGGGTGHFAYGGGVDMLFNFIEGTRGSKFAKFTFGGFLGIMLEGQTWVAPWIASAFENGLKSSPILKITGYDFERTTRIVQFQLPINVGFRFNFSKHSGMDTGVVIPLLSPWYIQYKGVQGSVTAGIEATMVLHRYLSVYANYVYSF